jgi:hypothetical protein
VGVVPMPEPDDGGHDGFVLLRWYKNRGRTDAALLWGVRDVSPRWLTLADAERLLDAVADDGRSFRGRMRI